MTQAALVKKFFDEFADVKESLKTAILTCERLEKKFDDLKAKLEPTADSQPSVTVSGPSTAEEPPLYSRRKNG